MKDSKTKRSKKLKKSKHKAVAVEVVNEPLSVGYAGQPSLVTLFAGKEIAPGGHALGPIGGLDLTGYGEYRLILHLVGQEGTPFAVQEIFGPAGEVDQMRFEVGEGRIGPKGVLNYRARFDIFGPKNLFIQITNNGDAPFEVNGSLYAVS